LEHANNWNVNGPMFAISANPIDGGLEIAINLQLQMCWGWGWADGPGEYSLMGNLMGARL
jgi:hypothetical protein